MYVGACCYDYDVLCDVWWELVPGLRPMEIASELGKAHRLGEVAAVSVA